jgi:hypothetical protein
MSLLTILASGARTASGIGSVVHVQNYTCRLIALLDVTATASIATDSLDVFIQDSIDNVNFTDMVRFNRVPGNVGVQQYYATVNLFSPPSIDQGPIEDCVNNGPGARQGPCGYYIRPKYVISGGESKSFTFSLKLWRL